MITVRSLRKSFSNKPVLNGVDLYVPRGQIVAIAGPNGSGKTTLAKCLLGMVMPDRGSIQIDGQTISPDGEFRRNISYMPQNPDFPANLKLNEILDMISELRRERPKFRRELTAYFGLMELLNRPFGKLSGGTKQKFAAVLACMFDSPLLIMDEPTAGLDPLTQVKFKDLLLRKKHEGKTILMISHLIPEIQQTADRLVLIDEGKIAISESITKILAKTGERDLDRALTSFLTDEKEIDGLKVNTSI